MTLLDGVQAMDLALSSLAAHLAVLRNKRGTLPSLRTRGRLRTGVRALASSYSGQAESAREHVMRVNEALWQQPSITQAEALELERQHPLQEEREREGEERRRELQERVQRLEDDRQRLQKTLAHTQDQLRSLRAREQQQQRSEGESERGEVGVLDAGTYSVKRVQDQGEDTADVWASIERQRVQQQVRVNSSE